MSNERWRSSRGWIAPLALVVVSFAVIVSVFTYGQTITDNVNYHRFQPNSAMEEFVTRTGMSDEGKFLFYASQPVLENAQGFNEKCGRAEAQTAILGCYNGRTIYIYDVQDERLDGIRATTAAHEMLHAAYDRLGAKEKQTVDKLLEAEFDAHRANERLISRMEFYERTEPGERHNELHSIIGTEIAAISPELETYYSRYFADRSKVVALHDQYESVFIGLQNRASEINGRLKQLSEIINADTARYNQEAKTLQGDIAQFNDRARRGEFSSQSEFTIQRQRLTARVGALEDIRAGINASVREYNNLADELKNIATQTEDLNRSLDSTLAPAPEL